MDAASTVKSTANGRASGRARDGNGTLDPYQAAMDAVSDGYVDVTPPWLRPVDTLRSGQRNHVRFMSIARRTVSLDGYSTSIPVIDLNTENGPGNGSTRGTHQ